MYYCKGKVWASNKISNEVKNAMLEHNNVSILEIQVKSSSVGSDKKLAKKQTWVEYFWKSF